MKTSMRLLVLLMALCMICGVLASCGDSTDTPGTTNTNTAAQNPESTQPPAAQDDETFYRPEIKNYDADFIILTSSNGSDSEPSWIYEENKPSGEVISNALYRRQLLMEETYGVTLVLKEDSEYATTISNTLQSGDYVFDVSMIPASDTFALALQGAYCNLLKYGDSLNLEAPYWDQRIQNEYRINDLLFTLEGDFSYVDEMRTMVVLYNEKVYDTYSYKETYGTPYSLVERNEWTLDTMLTMIKDMAANTNSDDVMNENDTWGMVSELTAVYYFFLGSGLKTMSNDSGELSLLLDDNSYYQRAYDVLNSTMNLGQNPDVVMANMPGAFSTDSVWTPASNIFEYDRALFRTTTLSAVVRLTDMKSNYGILPIPAYYEDQTEYYCWVSGVTAMPMAISAKAKDLTRTAEIAERFCYHSRYGADTLYKAFFEQMAYSRICRTPDDIKMLELVIDSKTFDLDQVAKITGIEPRLYTLTKNKNFTALSSELSTLVAGSKAKLNQYLIDILAKNL